MAAVARTSRIRPDAGQFVARIPDATPAIIEKYKLSAKQHLLAKVRYNRLVDHFFNATAYSLQNHLRTSVKDLGQIEVDEIYVAVKNTGQQFVIPVQAKAGSDQIGAVQIAQDLALCRAKFPTLTTRLVAVQFKKDKNATGEVIVMFELVLTGEEIKKIDEKHYRLVPASQITSDDLETMAKAK